MSSDVFSSVFGIVTRFGGVCWGLGWFTWREVLDWALW